MKFEIEAVAAAVFLTMVAVLALWLRHEATVVGQLRGQLILAADQHRRDAAALTGERDAVKTLQAAVDEWKKQCALSPVLMAAATQKIEDLNAQLNAQRAAVRAAQEKDRAVPACAFLLSTDLAAACPDVARELRQLPAADGGVR